MNWAKVIIGGFIWGLGVGLILKGGITLGLILAIVGFLIAFRGARGR